MIHNSSALGWFRKHLRIPTTGLLMFTFSFWSVQVKGATFAWDGGNGDWDVGTTAKWNTGGLWTNSLNNIASFGGTAGTVTLTESISAGGLTFNASDYTITAGTLTLGAPTGTTSPVIAVNGIDSRATIGSILAGSNGFTKAGVGSLLLTNSSNTFGGDIAIKDGVLIITDAGQLGTGTTAISVTGIAQSGNPGFSGGTLLLAGSATAGGSGMTLNREVSVSGRGPNAVNNTGGLVSVGYNTLAGGLTLGSAAGENRAWATHGTTTLGSLYLGTVGQSQILQGNGNWTVSGVVTGAENSNDRFIKTGQLIGTTLWLQNAGNTFTDSIRIDSGTLRVATNGALGQNLGTGQVDLNNGTLEARTDFASGFAGRTVRIRNNTTGTVFFDHDLSGGLGIGSSAQNQTVTMGALIRDAGANPGNITLNGRNGYNVSFTSFLPGVGDYRGVTITNNSSGMATFNGDVWNMNNAASSAFTVAGNADTVITGNVRATGGNHLLTKTGTGTFTYGGTAGTYTGSTTVTGTVVVTSMGAFNNAGAGAIQLNSGALDYRGTGETTTKLINLLGTTGNAIILANQPSGGALVINGNLVGAGGVGAKTLFLGGSSAGLVINEIGGVINDSTSATSLAKVGGNTWLYDPAASTYAAAVSVNSGATASGTGTNVFTVASSAGIIVGQAVTGTNVPAGSVVTGISGNTITISNNIGTTAIAAATALTFRASSNFTGNVTVGGGTLQVRPTASSGNGSDVINNGSQIILGADALTNNGWAGGIFEYQGSVAGGTLTEQVGALTATAGAGSVRVTANGGLPTLNFASLGTRTAGATLNLNPGANSGITFTAAAGTNGILGGYATFGADGTDFVASVTAGGTAAALSGQAALPTSGATSTVNYQSSADTTTAAQSINSLKMSGAQTITLGGVLTVTSGGILFDNSNGSALIQNNGTATNTLGAAAELIVTTNGSTPANALTINARIGSGAASLTKAGSGTLIVGGDNTYTGSTTVNAGILQMAAGSITASLGVPAAASVLTLRQDGTLDINGAGANVAPYSGASALNTLTVGALNGAGVITSSSASASVISLGSSTTSVASSVFSGIIQDGAGVVTVIKNGTSASIQALTGLNTYTGATIISGGSTLQATSLANGGVASSIGASSNAADKLVFNNGILRYQGSNAAVYQTIQTPSVSIDRLFTLAGNGTIQSSGQYGNSVLAAGTANNASLIFNNTGDIVFAGATGGRLLTLGGTSIGDNEMRIRLVNNDTPSLGFNVLSLTKADASLWILNPLASNTYTGTTTVSGGALRVASSAAAVQGLSASSPLVLNGGVLETSGSFTRTLGAAVPGVGTTVAITGGASGFSAATTDRLVVTLGGGDLTWGSTNFNPTALVLGSSTALGETEITNNIAIGAATRTVTVNNNGNTGTMVTAGILSGVISGAGTGGNALIKNGGGVLMLGNANTYTGSTRVDSGNLIVTSIGTGVSSSLGASGALVYNGQNADLNALNYVGQGEIANRDLTFQGSNFTANRVYRVDSSGTGALMWNTGTFVNTTRGDTVARVITLELRGANTDGNQMNLVLANSTNATFANVLHVSKTDGGVWILNPSTTNTFTGNININGGTLGLTADGIGSAGSIVFSNGALMAYGSALTTSKPVTIASNTAAIFSGSNAVTLNGLVTGATGNPWTISNNLEGGALLTIGGNFVNGQTDATARTLSIRGFGSTVLTGNIQNSAANSVTSLDIRIDNNATVKLDGATATTYTGATTLGQGTLILSKDSGVAQFGASSQFNFNGGVLTSDLALTGADKIATKVSLQGNPATISGSFDIELGAATGLEYNGNRFLLNNLDSGKTLTISGAVAPTATAQTLTLRGTGSTLITGLVTNGGVTGAGNLAFSGLGSLEITTNSTAQGVLTVNRNVVTLNGANGSWNAGSFALNPTGVLRLDNTATNNVAGRLSDTGAFAGNGGTLDIIGNVGGSTHSGGALNLNNVQTYITISGGNVDLTFASVNFANPGSALNLAGISNLGTDNKVKFTAALPANAQINGIMPRVYFGSDFATYDVTDGVKVFANYNPTSAVDMNAALAVDTVQANAGMTTTTVGTAAKTINALKLTGTGITVDSTAGATTTLTLAAAAILNTGGTNTIGATGVNMGVNFAANAGHIQVTSGTTLNLRAALLGTGGWAKAQTGSLNIFTPTFATGTVSLLNGTTKLISGGVNTMFQLQTTFINSGATLDLNGSAQYIGQLNDPGVLPNTGGTITSTGGPALLVSNTTTAATVNTEITNTLGNAVSFAKLNTSTLTIGTPWTYTGSTTLMGGTLALQDDATLIGTSAININGATLQLNNNGSLQTANYSRLGSSIPISLRDGALTFTSLVSDASTESMGALSSVQGSNTVTVTTTAPSAIGSADVSFASLSHSAGTTINFVGNNLGQPGNNSRITFRDGSPATVLGGALGAWAIANSSDYAAYNSGLGVGVVGQGGFVGYDGTFASGNITEIPATAATTTTLSGATTTGLLRIAGAFTNNIAFTAGTDTLALEQGGILRSNNNNATTIGTSLIRGTITSGTNELVVYNNQGTTTINSFIDGPTKLIKSGGGTLSLTAANTYTLGTSVVQGTLTLNGDVGTVVIPAGGLIIGGATVTMVTNAGQIDPSNVVTIRRSSTLTMVGDNTLNSLIFENNGGTGNPTVNVGSTLTLTNATPVSITTSNAQTLPVITGGTLALGSGAKTFSVEAPNIEGKIYTTISPALSIASIITGTGPIIKSGTGILRLSAQNTFDGLNVTGGGILIGGNSTPTQGGAGLTGGPLGAGLVTMSAGTTLLVDASRTIGNDISFAGTPTFDSTATTVWTLTLNGSLTGAGMASPIPTIEITNPALTVALLGKIPNIATITSFNKTGLGTLIFNSTGYTGNYDAVALGNGLAISLLHDGNSPNVGNGVVETINLGSVTFDTIGTGTVTVGRAGGSLLFPSAQNKIIAVNSINTALNNGLTVANNNGYGLQVGDSGALTGTPTFTVNTASASNITQGLYLTGDLSGTGFNKAGLGTLVINNATPANNTFSGNINITQGVVSVGVDGQLGSNMVVLNPSTGTTPTSAFRATGTFATSQVIQLANTANTRAIEVSNGNTLTLNAAFDLNAGAGTAAALNKQDLGTLVINTDNPTWSGAVNISQGAILINNPALTTPLGTGTINAGLSNVVGSALQLAGGVTVSNPLNLQSVNNLLIGGISFQGQLDNVSGINTYSGPISHAWDATIGARAGSTLNITGGIVATGTHRLIFNAEGDINLNTMPFSGALFGVDKFGAGTLTVSVPISGAISGTGGFKISKGTVVLNGAATTNSSGAPNLVYQGATLRLDNSGTNTNNRLTARAVTLQGGTFDFVSNNSTETAGAFVSDQGANTINIGGSGTAALTFASYAGNAGSSLNVTGTFGTATEFLKFTTNPALIPTSTGILNRVIVNGNELASYSASLGVVAFTGYSPATNILGAGATSTFMATTSTINSLATSQTINALTINNTAAVGGLNGNPPVSLALTSGTILANGVGGAFLNTPIVTLGAEGLLHVASGQSLTVNSGLSGTAGLTKNLAGELRINAQQFVSGTHYINGGTLKLTSTGATNTLLFNQGLSVNVGGVVDLNGNHQFIANLSSASALAAAGIAGGTVTNSSDTQSTLVANSNSNFGGVISGNIFLNKTGTGALNFQAAQTYTGATLINGGSVTLADFGALPTTSQPIEIYFSTLTLANTSLYDMADRVNNAAPITLRGGVLTTNGRQQYNSSETFGAVTFAEGHNAVITTTGGTNVNSLEVTIASLTRTGDAATIRFNATGQFGSSARLFITAAPTLTNNIIGPWAIVDREYASYDATYGIGALNGNGFAGYSGSGLNTNPLVGDNVRLTAAGTTVLAGNTTVNTLTFGQQTTATTLNLGGNTLATRGVLFGQGTDNINFAITNGNLTGPAGGGDLYLTHANFSGTGRTVSIDAAITDNGGPVRVIKTSGDTGVSVMTWNGNNTYTGGTVVNMGTLVLGATATLGTGGLTINQATLTQTASALIPASNALTMGGGSTLTLANQANTLAGITFNNMGGAAPTVTPTGTLTLTSGITVNTMNAGGIATIGTGTLDLNGAGSFAMNVGATVVNGVDVAPWQAGLTINAAIQNGGIAKSGDGMLLLSSPISTFAGGINVTAGGLIIGASSTGAALLDPVSAGPLGTGAVTMANGTTLVSTGAFAVANDFTFLGDTALNGTNSLTLNGNTTLPSTWNVAVTAPNVIFTIGNVIGSVGTDVTNKSGLGQLVLGNYAGTINIAGGLILAADGNTLGTPESLSLGSAINLTADTQITVNRSGGAPNSRNKTIQQTSLTNNGSILAVNNLSGYGLEITGATSFTGASTIAVGVATASNVVQGLTLSGVVSDTSGFTLVKSGVGTLALTNSGNTFGGVGQSISILGGVLSANSNGALGNPSNTITLEVDGTTGTGFRATGTSWTTGRTFLLNAANNAFEAVAGTTLTLTSPFVLSSASNALIKNDNGNVAITADNSGWTGAITINAGALVAANDSALGAGTVTINNVAGSALALFGGVTVSNPVILTGSSATGGINGAGHIVSASGVNTYSGLITQNSGVAGTYGALAGATLNITGGIAAVNSAGFYAETGGVINLQSTYGTGAGGPTFVKYGAGTLNVTSTQSAVTSAITITGGILNISGDGVKFGGTGAVTVAATSTLAIDDTGTATNNRLGGRPMTLNGGTFSYLGNDISSVETLGALTTARGNNTILSNNNGGTSALTFSRLSTTDIVTADGSLNFTNGSGAALGTATNKILFTTGPTLTNGIIQRATVNGSSFATWTAGNGIAAFTAYNGGSTTNINSVTATTGTVDANAAMTTKNLTANRTFNAIRLSGATNQTVGATGAAFVAGGATPAQLILNAGGILATGGGSHTLSVPVLSMGIASGTTTVQEFIAVDTGTSLNITSANVGNAGWVKTGAGTLTFSPPASPIAGRGASTLTGNANINNGTVILNGGNNTLVANQFMNVAAGGTLDLNGNSQLVRSLFTDGSFEGAGGIVTGSAASSTLIMNNDNVARSWSGQLTGALSFMRTGDNTMTFYSDNTYTGSTFISGGTTTLRDGARLSGTSDIEIVYATLNIDNAGGIKDLTDRVKDSATISLRGGTLAFLGRAQTASTETVGAVTLNRGASSISSTVGGTGINSADLTLASLNRTVGSGTVNFTAATGGQIGSSARILTPLINGVSTATVGGGLTNGIIGGWAIIGTSDFATYVPGLGIAPMGANGALQYSNVTSTVATLNSAALTDNISINVAVPGNSIPVSDDLTINSLRMGNIASQTVAIAAGKTLTLSSGGLLFFSTASQTIGSVANQGSLTTTGPELFIYTQGTGPQIINSAITGSGVMLVKSGSGALTLNGTNTYDGGTTINQGAVNLGPLSGIPLAANPANGLILSGSTLTLTAAGQIASGNIVTLNGNAVANLFGNNTLAGLVFRDDGGGSSATAVNALTGVLTLTGGITSTTANPASTSTVGGRLDLGSTSKSLNIGATTFNGQELAALLSDFNLQGVVGSAGGFTKDGDGVLQFNGQAIYTGLTDVVTGRVQIGATNAGSRFSRLNLQAGTALNLNGFSTILGSLSGSGFVMNSSASTTAQTLTVGFDGTDSTFSGTFQRFNDATPATTNLTKIGVGTLTLTAPAASSTNRGVLTVNRGVVSFVDAGSNSFNSSAVVVNEGGTLRLDNTGTVNTNNRLSGTALTLNGGALDFLGRSATASTELGGVLTLGPSASAINLTSGGSGGTAFVTFASLTQSAGSTAIVSGTGLGTDTRLLFTAAPTEVPATTGILARIAVGTDFATYDPTQGVIAFTGYTVPADINLAAATNTIEVTSATTTRDITLARTINAAKITDNNVTLGSSGLLLPTQGLTVTSGGILTNGNSAVIGTPVLAFGGTEGIFRVNGDTLNIQSSITGTAGFAKTGTGTLTLSTRQSYTGQTALSLGNLILAGGRNTILVAPTLTVNAGNLQVNGGVLDLNGNDQIFGALLNSNTLAFAGGVITNTSGTTAIVSSATGTGATIGANISGNIAFTKSGSGALTLPDIQTYTGATVIRGGTVTLQDRGALYSGVSLTNASVALEFSGLTLNNSNLTTLADLNPIRIPAAVPVTLRGSTLAQTAGGSVDTTGTINSLTVLGGASTITVNVLGSAGAKNTLTIGNMVRAVGNGSTIHFASDLGIATQNGAQVFINQINGVAPVNNSYLGANTIINSGEYGVYNTTLGVGRYGQTGFPAYAAALASGNNLPNNISSTGADVAISANTTIGALRLTGAATRAITFTAGTEVLNLAQGGLLRDNNNNATNIGTTALRGVLTSGGTATTGVTELVEWHNQNTVTINSIIANNGLGNQTRFVKAGPAGTTLTAANTYTGGTVVNAGTLTINATAGAGTVVIPAGGVTLNNANLTMSTNEGQIAATNDVIINGGGVLTLVGTNILESVTFDNMGGTTTPGVVAGTLLTLSDSIAINVTNNNLSSTPTISGTALTLSNANPVINVNAGLSPSGLVISATLGATTGPIVKTGGGSLILGGTITNNLTTGINVDAGALVFDNTNATTPYGTGTIAFANGTAARGGTAARTVSNPVSIAGDFTFGTLAADNATANATNNLTLSGTTTLAAGAHDINVDGLLMVGTISGQLTGGTNISKSGAGTLVLSNNTNDYGGSTTVNAGTLQVGAAGSIPDTSALVVNSGGFFNINGFAETVGSLAGAGVITNTGAAQTLTTGGDGTNTTFSGVITNQASALNLVKTGLGTQVLSGANTYTGTTAINGGTLNVGSVESLGVSGPLGAPTTPANSITFGGGTLQYSAANQFDYSSRFSTAANQAVSIDTNGQNVTFATNLSSVGGTLAKSGAGTLTLTADNGYTGSTSVSAGTLQVGNGSTGQLSGGGSVTVSGTDTTLSGSGSIAGSTLIGSGAIIAPGVGDTSASNHTLTFTAVSAPLTLVSGSQIQLGITNETFNSVGVADALATASYTDALTYIGANGAEFTSSWNVAPAFTADMDFINLTSGTISLGTRSGGAGTGTISVANLGYVASAAKGDVFNLIDWQGVMGGTFDAGSGFSSGGIFGDFDLPTLGLGLVWDTSAFTTHGIVVVVPEPSRALLLLLGLFGLMLRRRRIA